MSFFPTTNWTLLADATLSGAEDGQRALAEMCESYRRPVEAFLRSRGYRDADQEDLVQEFFFQWLKSRAWKRADRLKGKFRTFLLGAVNHMLSHHHRRQRTEKRGGEQDHSSLEDLQDHGFDVSDEAPPVAPEFDREWAYTLVANTLEEIRLDFELRDRSTEFGILRRFLPGSDGPPSLEEAAGQLGIEANTLKVSVHRLRVRFRERLRAAVARTVSAPHEVDEELAYLRSILSEGGRNLAAETGNTP